MRRMLILPSYEFYGSGSCRTYYWSAKFIAVSSLFSLMKDASPASTNLDLFYLIRFKGGFLVFN